METNIDNSWKEYLKIEFKKDYFIKLKQFVENEYRIKTIFPPAKLIFNAFNLCTANNIKVVIIGQDPYHGKNQANGLAFSVSEGVKIPPSLRNIYKELNSDIAKEIPISGNLEHWAKQGVLMINATLTERESEAASHQKQGWETFTNAVIKQISDNNENIVFLLWGKYAQKIGILIDETKHYILKSAHPSPFSAHRGFLGNKHFSKTNEYLKSIGKNVINW